MRAPGTLSKAEAAVWKRLAPVLEKDLRLTDATREAFAFLCQTVVAYEVSLKAVNELESLWIRSPNSALQIHPLEKIRQQRHKELLAVLVEWGLTPAALPRTETPAIDPEDEAFERLGCP